MRLLKVILAGSCCLGILWALIVWLLAPDEITNNYLPTALQTSKEETGTLGVPEKNKTNALLPNKDPSDELIEKTNPAGESSELVNKVSPQPYLTLEDGITSSTKPKEQNEESNSSFEKVLPGKFDQLKNSIGTWTTKAGAESTKPQEPPPDLEDRATLNRILASAIDEREMKVRTGKGKKQLMQNDKPFTGWAKHMRGNSGKVEELGLYRDGLKDGPWARWFSGKRFRELGLFRQGQRHGLYVTWYGSGKKKDAINYENDLEHGPTTTWYGSGKKWKEGHHKHGEKDGIWVTYDGRGKERNRQTYENGNPLD